MDSRTGATDQASAPDVTDEQAATDEAPAPSPAPRSAESGMLTRLRGRAWPRLEVALALLISGATFLVHDVAQILGRSLWVDEAWVADSTRAPLSQVPSLTSSSPIGWTFALRLVVFGGPQRYRLLPLLLLAAAVLMAYLIGRRAPLPAPVGGSLSALAVLLLPHALVRNDLKQYTGDAFCALLILWLTVRAEEQPTRGRLAALAVLAPVTLLFSYTGAFVGVASLLALALATLIRRRWAELRRMAVAGLAAAVGMAVVYRVAIAPHVIGSLVDAFGLYYPPTDRGPGPFIHYILYHLALLKALTNLGSLSLTALVLGTGLVTMVWARRLALALAVPILALGLALASALHRYPLLNARTSMFLFAVLAVVAAFGLAGAARAGYELTRRAGRALAGQREPVAAGLAVIAATAILLTGATAYAVTPMRNYVRVSTLGREDTAAATNWLRQRLSPDDVLILNQSAAFGYAYYARDFQPTFVPSKDAANGFVLASDPAQRVIVVAASSHTAPSLQAAVEQARTLLGPTGQIYIFESHLDPAQRRSVRRIVPPGAVYHWTNAIIGVLPR
jgi:hypothetical protein